MVSFRPDVASSTQPAINYVNLYSGGLIKINAVHKLTLVDEQRQRWRIIREKWRKNEL